MSLTNSPNWFSAPSGFYDYSIDQSLRFNNDDAPYLSRTHTTGNRQTFTLSVWFKRSDIGSSGSKYFLHTSLSGSAAGAYFYVTSAGTLSYYDASNTVCTTTGIFRDDAAWYNIIFAVDFTQSTGSNRAKIYVNGTQQTVTFTDNKSTSFNSYFNSNITHYISTSQATNAVDGYLAEMNFIDGQQLTPSSFGETKAGIWVPIDTSGLTFGTNGFRLTFEGTGTGTTSQGTTAQTNIGDDQSGGGHNWAVTNIASTDVVLDSPTNNWCTLNSLFTNGGSSQNFKEGNLKFTADSNYALANGTFAMRSGKWYWETLIVSWVSVPGIGITRGTNTAGNSYSGYDPNGNVKGFGYDTGGWIYGAAGDGTSSGATLASGQTSFTTGDVMGCSFDADAGELKFYKNNTLIYTISSINEHDWMPSTSAYNGGVNMVNFGQDSSFAGNKTAQGNADGNGKGDFYYSPPSGFLALCSANLPDPAIDPAEEEESTDYFNTVLYTGNGSTQSITGVGHQPDFVWTKQRNASANHRLFDSVRGAGKNLISNSTSTEGTDSNTLTSFDSDGFSLGNSAQVNDSGDTYVSWNWLAGGTAASNTDGTITSSVSANTKAGFSIVTWTGTGSNATVGHGLGVAPSLIIGKVRTTTDNWIVGHHKISSSPWNNTVFLNGTASIATSAAYWNNTAPTSSVFTTGTWWYGSEDYVAYCFSEVSGYSKFGSYTGNGSSDGPFVYTGFRPAWVMVKKSSATQSWAIMDNKRQASYNDVDARLFADLSNAESTGEACDFVSNGFKIRSTFSTTNSSSATYIYLAFAEQPFKYSNAR